MRAFCFVSTAMMCLMSCAPERTSRVPPEPDPAPEPIVASPHVLDAVVLARGRVAEAIEPPARVWAPVLFEDDGGGVFFSREVDGLEFGGETLCASWRMGWRPDDFLSVLLIDEVELTRRIEPPDCFPQGLESFRTRDASGEVHRWFRPREFRYVRSEDGGSAKGYCGEPMMSDICPHEMTNIVLEAKTRCSSAHLVTEAKETRGRYSSTLELEMVSFDYEHHTDTLRIVDVFLREPDPCPDPGEHWVELDGTVWQEFVTQDDEPSPPLQVPRAFSFDGPMRAVFGDVDPSVSAR